MNIEKNFITAEEAIELTKKEYYEVLKGIDSTIRDFANKKFKYILYDIPNSDTSIIVSFLKERGFSVVQKSQNGFETTVSIHWD